jgi:hypothetical protein
MFALRAAVLATKAVVAIAVPLVPVVCVTAAEVVDKLAVVVPFRVVAVDDVPIVTVPPEV